MHVARHKKFDEQFKKLTKPQQKAFEKRVELFLTNKNHPMLKLHPLTGKYDGCISMNITGDIRAVLEKIDDGTIYFVNIGLHSELYE